MVQSFIRKPPDNHLSKNHYVTFFSLKNHYITCQKNTKIVTVCVCVCVHGCLSVLIY